MAEQEQKNKEREVLATPEETEGSTKKIRLLKNVDYRGIRSFTAGQEVELPKEDANNILNAKHKNGQPRKLAAEMRGSK